MRRIWTNCPTVKRCATTILSAAALLVACDQAAERAAPTASPPVGGPQADLGVPTDVPSWVGSLLSGPNLLVADPAATQEELPGMGHKFQLFYAMLDDQDPLNATNDVVSVLTTTSYPAGIGVAIRNLPPGIKITALSDQIQLKYYFPFRSCGGGSPRIQLAIDRDGDGHFDGNAFGYVGHGGFGSGCLTGVWDFIDMTDNVPARWDLTQLDLGYQSWPAAVALITTTFPNHQVLSGSLVDDSCSFSPSSCGQAYYDLLTIENRTLENRQDTVH
ncbi:MAG: hypothetical protein AUH78_00455 [Gemmatimonadetes bacterium 13_1_40CM_4_69_8]|nr:MAG: hypothetical protein AUH78_00455 [Gemmatimonadetes bacterium 13_1_40CM_4_69_8]